MEHGLRRRTAVGLGSTAVSSWLLSIALSLVAAPSYAVPLSLALLCALLHFVAVGILLRRGASYLRLSWLLLSIPLAVFTIDNIGRLSYSLGSPLFRLLT